MEPVDQVERQLARHLAGRALLAAPVVVPVAALLRGGDGALGAAIAVAVVAVNFLAAAGLASFATPMGPGAIATAAMGGYVLRLGSVFVALLALRGVDAVDMASLVLTIAGLHLALLALEIRSVRLSLAEPGLRVAKPLSANGSQGVATPRSADLAAKE